MTPTQRQILVNAGFSRKRLDDVQFILDRIPTAKHDAFITDITTPRAPFKSTSHEMTPAEVQASRTRQANQIPLTDAEVGRLVADGVRDEVRAALDRIQGRVN